MGEDSKNHLGDIASLLGIVLLLLFILYVGFIRG